MARKKEETADSKLKMETPEQKIVKHQDTDVVVKNESMVIFQVKKVLTEDNYNLLSKWVRKENEKSGLKIVIAPHSVEVKVGEK